MEADWLIPKLTEKEKKEFSLYYNERSVFLYRLTSIVVISASFAYFYLDYLAAPHSFRLFWSFRFIAIIGLATAFILSFFYKNYFIKHFQLIVTSINILYNILILLMIYYSRPDEMSYTHYFTGILVIFIVAIPLRIRLIPLLINTFVIGALYILLAIFKQHLLSSALDMFINNMFFLLSTILAVIVAAYVLEIFIRKGFLNQKVLKAKNQEILTQKEEIEAQRDELEAQKIHLEKQNKEITDSIQYAKRIQKAVLPYARLLEAYFENFIFFLPRDIVSGDFYWFKKMNFSGKELTFIAVADCTGHGVPGAFVSMLGISFLNEIIISKNVSKGSLILNELRERIKASLSNEDDKERKDGMDIALIIYDEENMQMEFTGAYRPAYICRKKSNNYITENKQIKIFDEHPENVLIELKPDKMPIGWYIVEKPFESKTIKLQPNDKIYLFSDGYMDQIGGTNKRKFSIKPFKRLLCNIYNKDMNEQKLILTNTLNEWKLGHKQIDDILVLGFKV